jgi:hypothetical protein
MTLHLIKLCVGAESIDDLNEWIAYRHLMSGSKEALREHVHITRMMPKRKSELLEGGSLYWVIKGLIACRQQLLDIRAFRDDDGISRCALASLCTALPSLSGLALFAGSGCSSGCRSSREFARSYAAGPW